MTSPYRQARSAARANEYRRVIIREVNPAEGFITGETSTGDKLRVNFDLQHPLVAMPEAGELWTITRFQNEWRLDRRLEDGSEQTALQDLQPGDRRIEATNKLYLNGKHVVINGTDINDSLSNLTDEFNDSLADVLVQLDLLIPAGITVPYAGTTAPAGWEFADGTFVDAVADPTYERLWNAIGTTHGGTGKSHFKKPDSLGRMIVGRGTHTDVATIGATDGLPDIDRTFRHFHSTGTLNITASGSHVHTFAGTPDTITGGAHGHSFTGSSATTGTNNQSHTHSAGTFSISGGSHGHSINDPSHRHGIDWGNGVQGFTPGSGETGNVNNSWNTGNSTTGISINSNTHSHPASEFSGATAVESATHDHTFTAAGTISNTDTHTHSFTPAGTIATNTHTHANADFSGVVGSEDGVSETSAYIVLPYIIKL